jgi:hypothetical protein
MVCEVRMFGDDTFHPALKHGAIKTAEAAVRPSRARKNSIIRDKKSTAKFRIKYVF